MIISKNILRIVLIVVSLSIFADIGEATVIPLKFNQNTNNPVKTFVPGDAVLISTFPDTNSFLNNVFPIDGQGFVEFPIEGKVKITDMSADVLQEFLKSKFKVWLRSPNIYAKPLIRISLLGGFSNPGLYYVDSGISLWEAVRVAGGPVLEDGIYEMRWERNGDELDKDLLHLFESGASLAQSGFKSGDQIWTKSPTSETFWTNVNNLLPILSISTTIFLAYISYQQIALQAR